MSIETIHNDINSERITFGPHLVQRMWENGISIDQVLDTIVTGTVNKKEKDERSRGKFTKYTISVTTQVQTSGVHGSKLENDEDRPV